ncbi:7-cyano-7-deazaguanine synthase [Methanobrevibacter arboriphilus]|nr:7-cyano-7-deazaguanine synthase [Methanobrevibacter arboriphilus]
MKINKIHVESYSDYLIKEYRMKLSLEKLNSFIKEQENEKSNQSLLTPIENLKSILEIKIENVYNFDFNEYFNNHDYELTKNENKAIVALSGGVDSSFSLVIAKKLGFNPIAVTIDPRTIILPKQFKDNIKKLCKEISVKHEYIPMDYTEIIQDSLSGNLHPCGRCSKETASALFNYGRDNNINLVIFGDMLSTGSQCITKYKINKTINNSDENNIDMFRLNLPATLSVGKEEIKKNILKYNLEQIKGFGCPLLYESHKKYPYFKKFSIQRILRETRSGALEPGEALDLIWSFYRTEK